MHDLMRGKRGLIMGLANDRSLAWGIARELRSQGAELAFTYNGEAVGKRVGPLAASLGSDFLIDCNVSDEAQMDAAFERIRLTWGELDFLVHAIGYSPKESLRGRFVDTELNGFLTSMNISVYSFVAAASRASQLMRSGGTMLTLSYYGAEKVIPRYNVMGVAKAALEASVKYLAMDLGSREIRVNAISAGPVKTLASSAIGEFRHILKWAEDNAPLKRSITIEDVGRTAAYLLSDMSSGVSGEIHHVDAGYHITGMKFEDIVPVSLMA